MSTFPPVEVFLERCFSAGNRILDLFSERWHRGANRRTIIILVVGGSLFAYLYLSFVRPPDAFPVGELIAVPSGESLSTISGELEAMGVIRDARALRFLVTLTGDQHNVRAGDYLFKEPRDVFFVARALVLGAYGLEPERFRVPEGATVDEIGEIFDTRLQRFDKESFFAQAEEMEGFLFPDTYFFLPNASEATVVAAMRQNFDTKIAPLQPQIASSTLSLKEVVVLASILEREAYNTRDRRMIAGVLYNRLEKDMPLQVDATFAYTIGKGTFQLTRADLKSDSPYNTYVHKGLPPGAIGNPSLDSLEAAVDPIDNDYIFFLADHSGITHYCKTYACQLANKARYF